MDYSKHRFNEVLSDVGIKKADITRATGISSGYLSEISSGKKPLTHSVIEAICEAFKVEPWIFFISPKSIPDKKDAELISRFASLPDDSQKNVWHAIEMEEFKIIRGDPDRPAQAHTLHEKASADYKHKKES